ncbi:MAG TPA: PEP-utilizing enzyme, partial [Candidatus Limnocylindrales bacterium]|nr:PEP-utilizing enzyme [Candidatus Limnocylindrales bacterium]
AIDPRTLGETELLARVDELMRLTRRMAYANIVAPLLMNAYGSLVRRRSDRLGIDGARVDPALGMEGIHDFDPRSAIDALAQEVAAVPEASRAALDTDGYGALAEDPALAGLRTGIEAFLDRFGHLGDNGNDFSTPRWHEQPDTVVRMILHAQPAPERAALGWDDVRPRVKGPQRVILGRLFRRAATFRRLRESVSFQYTYGYELFRGTFLALGEKLVARRVLAEADDVFYLTLDEVRAAVRDGGGEAARIAATRRAEVDAAEDLDLPEVILGDDFVPRHRLAAGATTLVGVPSARGTYRGPARVIRSTDQASQLRSGDVLVVPYSDVAWTPLFARAGAVVAESGGMLSHSSIVAREHGIPCVVSAAGCLGLRDGAMVHVDGFTGVVTVEEA